MASAPAPALLLPVIPAGQVPGAAGVLTTNQATSAAAANNGILGAPSNKGGRKTRRRFKKKRLMSRKYCKKTPCRRMGFTQKASCRQYKNCYK